LEGQQKMVFGTWHHPQNAPRHARPQQHSRQTPQALRPSLRTAGTGVPFGGTADRGAATRRAAGEVRDNRPAAKALAAMPPRLRRLMEKYATCGRLVRWIAVRSGNRYRNHQRQAHVIQKDNAQPRSNDPEWMPRQTAVSDRDWFRARYRRPGFKKGPRSLPRGDHAAAWARNDFSTAGRPAGSKTAHDSPPDTASSRGPGGGLTNIVGPGGVAGGSPQARRPTACWSGRKIEIGRSICTREPARTLFGPKSSKRCLRRHPQLFLGPQTRADIRPQARRIWHRTYGPFPLFGLRHRCHTTNTHHRLEYKGFFIFDHGSPKARCTCHVRRPR